MLHFVYANDVQLCLWPTAFDRLMFSLPLIKVTWNNVGQVVLNFQPRRSCVVAHLWLAAPIRNNKTPDTLWLKRTTAAEIDETC